MADYRSFYDRSYLGAWDLAGKDATVTIARVEGRELIAAGNKKSKKPVVFFQGADKGLALNKVNGKMIASMYTPDTTQWVGKKITLYATTTMLGPDTVECIRVRPTIPPDKKVAA